MGKRRRDIELLPPLWTKGQISVVDPGVPKGRGGARNMNIRHRRRRPFFMNSFNGDRGYGDPEPINPVYVVNVITFKFKVFYVLYQETYEHNLKSFFNIF